MVFTGLIDMKVLKKIVHIRASNDGKHCSRRCRFISSDTYCVTNRVCSLYSAIVLPVIEDISTRRVLRYVRLRACKREFGMR